jgi:hypothetical protein
MKANTLYTLTFILFFGCLMISTASAQSFQSVTTTLPDLHHGGSSWGDYDNDGDLDLVLNGQMADWTAITKVFENDNGTFIEVTGSLPGLYGGSVAWGDFDNDDDLDLLVCGMNEYGEGSTVLLQNNEGVFDELSTSFTGIADGHALWFDENRDGWLDILIGGDTLYNTPTAKIYHNNGDGTFSLMDSKLPASLSSSYTAGDYDNDGDDDIFITGYYENTYATRLLRNDGEGSFVDTEILFDSVAYGDMIFLDIDNDQDLDVVYMGSALSGEYIARVYRNNGNNDFSKVSQTIEGEWVGQIDAADFDNDGDPDLAITGALCCGDALTELYKNDGNGHFSLYNTSLPYLTFSQIQWGDFDNDGDADFLLVGLAETTTGQPSTNIFRNMDGSNTFGPNNPPDEPTNLMVTVDQDNVTFSWDASNDDLTPSEALTYNLYVGTEPGSASILSPLANPVNGFNRVFHRGNTDQNTGWTLHELPAGIYYWSVQALDHARCGSEFAPEQSFEITWVGIDDPVLDGTASFAVFPNPADKQVTIITTIDGLFEIRDLTGKVLKQATLTEGANQVQTDWLKPGMYLLQFHSKSGSSIQKLLKK